MATQLDATVRPVQCSACGSWCLLGSENGFKVAVSAQPLTLDGYRAALLAGLTVWWVSDRQKLKRVRPGGQRPAQWLLEHPCASWAAVPLSAPQKPVQPRVPCSPMCTGSCELCDVPPFDAARALVEELGARVVSITVHGKEVYRDESLA